MTTADAKLTRYPYTVTSPAVNGKTHRPSFGATALHFMGTRRECESWVSDFCNDPANRADPDKRAIMNHLRVVKTNPADLGFFEI